MISSPYLQLLKVADFNSNSMTLNYKILSSKYQIAELKTFKENKALLDFYIYEFWRVLGLIRKSINLNSQV